MTLVSVAEFAALLGRSKQRIYQLKAANRLVMVGRKVDVDKSRALIEASQGSRDDVARRHAENRGAADPQAQPPAENAPAARNPGLASGEGNEPDPESFGPLAAARHAKILAESRRAVALAEREEIERDKLAGELLDRTEVEAAFKSVGAQIRSLMETFPDQVAPLVAPVATLEDCHALLTEQCRNVLVNFNAACLRQAESLQKGGA